MATVADLLALRKSPDCGPGEVEPLSSAQPFPRSACAIANSLDVFGDKWSLLVVRDLLYGKRTYGELADSPERIPTNILADRLRRLEGAGILVSTPYQHRPTRYAYTLTSKGNALGGVLLAMVQWAKEHVPGTVTLNEAAAGSPPAAAAKSPRRTRGRRGG